MIHTYAPQWALYRPPGQTLHADAVWAPEPEIRLAARGVPARAVAVPCSGEQDLRPGAAGRPTALGSSLFPDSGEREAKVLARSATALPPLNDGDRGVRDPPTSRFWR